MAEVQLVDQLFRAGSPFAIAQRLRFQHRQDVLLSGQLAKNRRLLGKIADAEVPRPQVHRHPRDVGLVHQHAPAFGLHQPYDHVKAGCLAGAIRAQQAHHFAAGDSQVNVPYNLPPLIALTDPLGNQCLHASRCCIPQNQSNSVSQPPYLSRRDQQGAATLQVSKHGTSTLVLPGPRLTSRALLERSFPFLSRDRRLRY